MICIEVVFLTVVKLPLYIIQHSAMRKVKIVCLYVNVGT
jgi:hypothetical protein